MKAKSKTKTAIRKKPEELYECEKGKEIILVFDYGEVYSGFFQELNDDEIILKSTESEDMIGLPYNRLRGFLERLT